jgi:hypothetical protein
MTPLAKLSDSELCAAATARAAVVMTDGATGRLTWWPRTSAAVVTSPRVRLDGWLDAMAVEPSDIASVDMTGVSHPTKET